MAFSTVLFIFVMAEFLAFCLCGASQFYYITSSQSDPCPEQPCLTLSQFAANSSKYAGQDTTMAFLPGTHKLDSRLSIQTSVCKNLSLVNYPSHSRAMITCKPPAEIKFSTIDSLQISGLIFSGCESTILLVSQFTVTDSNFYGQQYSKTALKLDTTNSIIFNTSFVSNKIGSLQNSTIFHAQERVGGAVTIANSKVIIEACKFLDNVADSGGAIFGGTGSIIAIINSTFNGNIANGTNCKLCSGGAIYLEEGMLNISGSEFSYNFASKAHGGAVVVIKAHMSVGEESIFTNNYAAGSGGALAILFTSLANIEKSTFTANYVNIDGGAIEIYGNSTVNVIDITFTANMADFNGGAMDAEDNCMVNIIDSTFYNHTIKFSGGGAVSVSNYTTLVIRGSVFTFNIALNVNPFYGMGGAIYVGNGCDLIMYGSNFTRNKALYCGGALYLVGCKQLEIYECLFSANSAFNSGGAIASIQNSDSLNIVLTNFISNNATFGGAVSAYQQALLSLIRCKFTSNSGKEGGAINAYDRSKVYISGTQLSNNTANSGVLYLLQSTADVSNNTIFSSNFGSILLLSSNMTMHGYVEMQNNFGVWESEKQDLAKSYELGGAITAFKSEILFYGKILFWQNFAKRGGAIHGTDTKLYLTNGNVTMTSNTAEDSGGALYLYQSELNCKTRNTLQILDNHATENGGGVCAISSQINVDLRVKTFYDVGKRVIYLYTGSIFLLTNNLATRGGGIYLESSTKLAILKWNSINDIFYALNFTRNSADYGGAMYIEDKTNTDVCEAPSKRSVITECFLQMLALHSRQEPMVHLTELRDVEVYHNTARLSGPNLYGGLLDRCTLSQFSEAFYKYPNLSVGDARGIDHFKNMTGINNFDSVHSDPVRICFCRQGHPDCAYQPPLIRVKKGKRFPVELVTVDQVNHTLADTLVHSLLNSTNSGIGAGQLVQKTQKGCSQVYFNIFSPHSSEVLSMYPEGPCKSAESSRVDLEIEFIPCTCPVGFQPVTFEASNCECDCDIHLKPYITACYPDAEILLRKGNVWISYLSNNLSTGFIIHPHCPLDYCLKDTNITFNSREAADEQCAYNRSGLLCGICESGLSLSLGSSRCLACSSDWIVKAIGIIIAALTAGGVLVIVLLVLNLTVAVGTLNGIIFYANIVDYKTSTFFPFPCPNIITVFIAWLNLSIGIDTCFIDGMDTYWKTWLQLAFPTYVLFLVVMVIVLSECSSKFAKLISKRNPIATLDTLILLSYTTFLRIIITALSFTTLEYPDGSKHVVWLPDASISYLSGKHIPLFAAAIIILTCGSVFTFLLLFWQCFLKYQDKRIFKFASYQKLNHLFDPYHAPYTSTHRYWTGMLLLFRALLYVVSAMNVSSDPAMDLLSIGVATTIIMLLKSTVKGMRIYKKWFIEFLEISCYVNLILFCFAKYFILQDERDPTVIAYISGAIAFVLFTVAILYHLFMEVFMKTKIWKKWSNERERMLLSSENEWDEIRDERSTLIFSEDDKRPELENDCSNLNRELKPTY